MKTSLHLTFFLFFFLGANYLNAQGASLQWVKTVPGDSVTGVCTVDASGNVYTVGHFSGTRDFDPGTGTYNLTSAGSYDVFILKLNASGNFIFAKRIGGNMPNYGFDLALDAVGNIYLTGLFSGIVDFDPGVATYTLNANNLNSQSSSSFILKLDPSGNFIWAKNTEVLTAGGDSEAYSLNLDGSGNPYITGSYRGTVDFDPGAGVYTLSASAGIENVFVLKLSSSGNLAWVKSLGNSANPANNRGYSITTDSPGNIYITGQFERTVDFDPGVSVYTLTAIGYVDAFVVKLDASGNFVWAKQLGGANAAVRGRSIARDQAGNIYSMGSFDATVDFNPAAGTYTMAAIGNGDIYISKLDASGNFLWAKSIGGPKHDNGFHMSLDPLGNIYTTGNHQATTDFDPGAGTFSLTATGSYNFFISELDPLGNFVWAQDINGLSGNNGVSIRADGTGNIYATGWLNDPCDFDPGPGVFNVTPPTGHSEMFILKLGGVPTDIKENKRMNNIKLYPNPNTGEFVLETETSIEFFILNVFGQIVHNETTNGTTSLVNIRDLDSGIYFLKLLDNKNQQVIKVIKQ